MNLLLYVLLVDSSIKIKIKGGEKVLGVRLMKTIKKCADPRRFRLTRQTSIGKRHLNFYATHPLLIWPVISLHFVS